MTKRVLLFLLVICLFMTLCACGEVSTTVTLDDFEESETVDSPDGNLFIFSTRSDKEFLEFLTTTFDNQNYVIIDITTGMETTRYGESYMVTYAKKAEKSDEETVSYKYYLYKTREQSEYLKFYSSFDFDRYEIVDISTRLETYFFGQSYVVTYREPD